jgi:hypothetical protein
MPAFDLLSKKRVRYSSTSLLQLAAVEQLPRAMNEVWNLGPQTPSGGWRAIRFDMPAA